MSTPWHRLGIGSNDERELMELFKGAAAGRGLKGPELEGFLQDAFDTASSFCRAVAFLLTPPKPKKKAAKKKAAAKRD